MRIRLPISSALAKSLRQADALVVSNRGIFCVGTEKKIEIKIELKFSKYNNSHPKVHFLSIYC